DRADPDSPDMMPEWAAYLIALLILFLLEHSQSMQQRRARRLASKAAARPAQPQDSAQPPAAPIANQPDDAIACTRRGRAAAPELKELPHVLKALLARLQQCDGGPSLWSQLEEALGIAPGPIGPDTAVAPNAPAPAPISAAKIRRARRRLAPALPAHALLPVPLRRTFAHPGTGPPTGPPAVSRYQSYYA
ncbi:MAG TPA: hypothetical protein VGG99_29895, partial [Acetobacteraceae bacterium]